ncbi:MAG: type I phosphomannose isomerase catalytic subunit, partial [Myxococcota bacterium]
MRPRKDDYDRYIALLQYGRDCGWDQARISREGPFRMADVGMSMMLLQADRDLAAWAQALGYQDASAELQRAIARAEAGVQTLWDPSSQCFCSRDLVTGEPTGMVTSASFLAFYAGVGRPEQHAALFQHWDRIADRVDFMVPSFDPEHPAFDHLRYWRGPCWAVVNYMVAQGLERLGHPDRAVRVRGDTRALIRGVGFAEAFSPVDGSGTGGQNFSWTAAMWLAWASEGPLAGLGPTKLAPRLQTYAWGDERFLPDLLGVEAEGPVAEAWYGAHPRGPAMAERDGGLQPLDRVLAEVGEEVLGSEVQQRFGGLPYLIKILAMNKPLSIQVHPDRDQAAAGFAREEAEGRSQDDPQRFYRDERHKPELLVALRTTYALCGFRPFETILGALAAHPELRALLLDGASPGDVEALLHAYFSLPDAAVERALAELL